MDEKQEFIKGMMVTIPSDLKFTEEIYGLSEAMLQLIGTSQEIGNLIEEDDFYIAKWLWDKRDFKISESSVQTPEKRLPVLPVRKQHIETSQEIENIPELSEPLKKIKPKKILLKDLINS